MTLLDNGLTYGGQTSPLPRQKAGETAAQPALESDARLTIGHAAAWRLKDRLEG